MGRDNTVVVTGNLTRDPELRATTAGKSVCDFGLAWNNRYQVNGEWTDEPNYFDVTAWGELGDNVAETLHKGDRVTVSGTMRWRQWETEEKEKRSKVSITADDVAISLRWAVVAEIKKTHGSSAPAPPHSDAEAVAAEFADEKPF